MIDCHVKEKTQHLELPAEVKAMFRKPADERSWAKLETFRQYLTRRLQREETVHFGDATTLTKFEKWYQGEALEGDLDITPDIFAVPGQQILKFAAALLSS